MTIDATVAGPDSNAYVTEADADSYFADRGSADWAALDSAAKEAAIITATAFIDGTYGTKWVGERFSDDQALDWPRSGVVLDGVEQPTDEIISRVVAATCELALKSTTETLSSEPLANIKRKNIEDVLEIEYRSSPGGAHRYAYVATLLAPLLLGPVGNSTFQTHRMTRA